MFQGETAISIDDKGRLAVPTAYRELIAAASGGRMVFTYNPFEHGCLWLFPLDEWEKVRDQVNALPSVKAVHRALQMKLVGAAAHVEPDGAGRVLVPASQRTAAGIEKKAVLLGMGSKFELWSEQAHLAKIRQTIGEDEITDAMLDLKL
ncbi:division/cell wall cluster transcriptional repressor MraZ [Tahibacter amnicola]|uniref:Transcriptional regulator MraZ n=1 Tax=Tahibacter amnicola TaxID=2976241 RepID=A0ABY6BH70_9GAMM|nr:division/cell wall cluster transcriptional repressor MraZ [Tahibacter amnicola]UXI67720.1 division/cell wall cluster transcriptional repressor MraZ [Tahibacter amnicola]